MQHLQLWLKILMPRILTKYDQTIETLYIDNCLIPYSKGEKDKKKAIQDFKDAVVNAYPDLKI